MALALPSQVLALPLCNLVNLSIKQSLFPDQCKIAKLKPLFKKGSKSDPTNYRQDNRENHSDSDTRKFR